jgi:hypothetical protein
VKVEYLGGIRERYSHPRELRLTCKYISKSSQKKVGVVREEEHTEIRVNITDQEVLKDRI